MRTATTALVSDHAFRRVVEARSHERLVLAVFVDGADAEPVPTIEQLCIDRGGCFDVALVDFQRAPAAARRCGATTSPAVCGFRDGRALERFDGPGLIDGLRAWLESRLPHEAERALAAVAPDDPDVMLAYSQALACDPSCARALLGLARLHAVDGEPATALALATRVKPDAPEAGEAAQLAEQLRTRVDPVDEDATRRARIALNLEDADTRIALVRTLWRRGKRHEAHAITSDLRSRIVAR